MTGPEGDPPGVDFEDKEVPRAVIFGCSGHELTDEEREFYRTSNPLGFILFARNVETPDQVTQLVADLRDTIDDPAAPVLIDQEGGRVQRLRPPHWRDLPTARAIGQTYGADRKAGLEAVSLLAGLLAEDLHTLGIDVDCWPVLDLARDGADPIIGDRAFGLPPADTTVLGRSGIAALRQGGVTPVIKHIPGHGRALVDSHKELPKVDASKGELAFQDFRAFQGFGRETWGMTAHIVYESLDPNWPATQSAPVIADIIRGEIGFDGLLLSDDVSMGALSGAFDERTARALEAGCDIVLHCNGDMEEMEAVAAGARAMTPDAQARFRDGRAQRDTALEFDPEAAFSRLMALLGDEAGSG